MNLKFYLEKLKDSDEFEEFSKEFKGAYLCSAFFSIDTEGKDNKQNLDFYAPKSKEFFSFSLNEKIEKSKIESFGKDYIPEEISEEIDVDFDEMKDLILQKMADEKVSNKVQKILYSLQQKDSKPFLIATVFISGLGLIKAFIELKSKKIIEFEKKSLFDIFKVIKKK